MHLQSNLHVTQVESPRDSTIHATRNISVQYSFQIELWTDLMENEKQRLNVIIHTLPLGLRVRSKLYLFILHLVFHVCIFFRKNKLKIKYEIQNLKIICQWINHSIEIYKYYVLTSWKGSKFSKVAFSWKRAIIGKNLVLFSLQSKSLKLLNPCFKI